MVYSVVPNKLSKQILDCSGEICSGQCWALCGFFNFDLRFTWICHFGSQGLQHAGVFRSRRWNLRFGEQWECMLLIQRSRYKSSTGQKIARPSAQEMPTGQFWAKMWPGQLSGTFAQAWHVSVLSYLDFSGISGALVIFEQFNLLGTTLYYYNLCIYIILF